MTMVHIIGEGVPTPIIFVKLSVSCNRNFPLIVNYRSSAATTEEMSVRSLVQTRGGAIMFVH